MIIVAAVCRVFQKREWLKIAYGFLSNLDRPQRSFWNDFLETETQGFCSFNLFYPKGKKKYQKYYFLWKTTDSM